MRYLYLFYKAEHNDLNEKSLTCDHERLSLGSSDMKTEALHAFCLVIRLFFVSIFPASALAVSSSMH